MDKLILFLMGPQGSGKDTQANLLSKHYGIPTFSAGELLRDEVKKGTQLGKEINEFISKGHIVPTKIIYNLIIEKVDSPECNEGFILNGYPRNIEQAKAIEGKIKPTFIILLDIPDDVAIERLSHRMICPKCGKIFFIKDTTKPAYCDSCNVPLVRREDDKPEVIKERLRLYHEDTEPLKEFYKDNLIVIDGTKSVQQVFEGTISEINKRFKRQSW